MDVVIIQVIFWSTFIVFSFVAFYFFISVFTGAPYVPTSMANVLKMIDLAKLKKGDRVADLGSGDGRLIIEAVKKGAIAEGFEINPGLVAYSYLKIKQNKLEKNAKVYWKSLYKADFSKYNVIFIVGFIQMMRNLEEIFEIKLKKGTKVICYAFPLPHKKPDFSEKGIYFYQY